MYIRYVRYVYVHTHKTVEQTTGCQAGVQTDGLACSVPVLTEGMPGHPETVSEIHRGRERGRRGCAKSRTTARRPGEQNRH